MLLESVGQDEYLCILRYAQTTEINRKFVINSTPKKSHKNESGASQRQEQSTNAQNNQELTPRHTKIANTNQLNPINY